MSNAIDGIHTTTNPKGTGWANQAGGVILSMHRDKPSAVAEGRVLAKKHRVLLTIHRRDGTVLRTQTYEPSPIA